MSITGKKQIIQLTGSLLQKSNLDVNALATLLHKQILSAKIKFPLLEEAALLLHESLPTPAQIALCDAISEGRSMGGNVVIGILLRELATQNLDLAMESAVKYIGNGQAWYVSDIIGERMYGTTLLQHPRPTISFLRNLARHPNPWVVRSIGAGVHYANKRGLNTHDASEAFLILLSLAKSKEKQVRTGIGWAAKTTAKFHSKIIELHRKTLSDFTKVDPWFVKKVETGLKRNRYAQGN